MGKPRREAKCRTCAWKGKRGYDARRHAGAEGHVVIERVTFEVAAR